MMKLTINLVPSSSWYNNLRKILTDKEWEKCKEYSKLMSGGVCCICGGIGLKHPTECHEEWGYDDKTHIQKLMGIVALCPSCHEVKHIGLAKINNHFERAYNHFKEINQCDKIKTLTYINQAFKDWEQRSRYQWTLDLSYLETINNHLNIDEKRMSEIQLLGKK